MIVYHNDHLGTPQKMTDTSGGVVWSATYDAFGKVTVDAGSTVVNNLRFPGQYYDAETGWQYNYHRFYDPGTGRYVRVDSLNFSSLIIIAQNSLSNIYRSIPNSKDVQTLLISYLLYQAAIESSQAPNPYPYVLNNSLRLIDPKGDFSIPGAIVGGAIGGVWGAFGAYAGGASTGGRIAAALGGAIAGGVSGGFGFSTLPGAAVGAFTGGVTAAALGGNPGGIFGATLGGGIGGAFAGIPGLGALGIYEGGMIAGSWGFAYGLLGEGLWNSFFPKQPYAPCPAK